MVGLVDRKGCRVEIKYHLDEHIDAAVAAGLRLRGVDVTTTVEQELQGASDLQQLAFAHAQGRMVSCLEGGYHLSALARSVAAHLRELAGVAA